MRGSSRPELLRWPGGRAGHHVRVADHDEDVAQRANYATDENISKRQSLMELMLPPDPPQPALWDEFTWRDGSVVIDVGCGNGLWSSMASDRNVGGLTLGLDISVGMLHALGASAPRVVPVQADAERLPFVANAADAVLALWMMYHLRDVETMLREVVRVLEPGGLFIATTNAARSLGDLDDLYLEAAQRAAGRSLLRWLPPLAFTAENGEATLAPHFPEVQTTLRTFWFEVPDPEPIVTYASSLREPTIAEVGDDLDFERFLREVREIAARALTDGPIRFARTDAVFVATTRDGGGERRSP